MIQRFVLTAIAVILLSVHMVGVSYAEEIVLTVSGNGENSSSEIKQETTKDMNVTQGNTANVITNIQTESNTGNNEANHNSGDVAVTTGNAQEHIAVTNANINNNTAKLNDCCPTTSSATISGNGSNSSNSVTNSTYSVTNIFQNNNAYIANNLHSNLNTGNNQASGNLGNVKITTGNIDSKTSIVNKNINLSTAYGSAGGFSNNTILITKNGADSNNTVTVKNIYGMDITVYNTADITNNVSQDVNTGNNTAKNNAGDVSIKTGDITVATSILNENINGSIVKVTCCEEKEKPQPPQKEVPPVTPPSPPIGGGNGCVTNCGGGGKGGNGGPGSILGASTGPTLPATGAPWTLLITIFALFLFATGVFLRHSTGISPPAFA